VNEYTIKIHSKGWSVVDALKRWNISRDSYDRWRNDLEYKNRLDDLIGGLTKKEVEK
jgi:hypothetical protein